MTAHPMSTIECDGVWEEVELARGELFAAGLDPGDCVKRASRHAFSTATDLRADLETEGWTSLALPPTEQHPEPLTLDQCPACRTLAPMPTEA